MSGNDFTNNNSDALVEDVRSIALEELRSQLQSELQDRRINPLFYDIAMMYVDGHSLEDIAEHVGITPTEISLILDRPEVKMFCNHIITTEGYMSKLQRIRLANKVINKIVEEAEEYDAPYTSKDLLEWLKLLQGESKIIEEKAPKIQINNQQNNMVSLIEELLDD